MQYVVCRASCCRPYDTCQVDVHVLNEFGGKREWDELERCFAEARPYPDRQLGKQARLTFPVIGRRKARKMWLHRKAPSHAALAGRVEPNEETGTTADGRAGVLFCLNFACMPIGRPILQSGDDRRRRIMQRHAALAWQGASLRYDAIATLGAIGRAPTQLTAHDSRARLVGTRRTMRQRYSLITSRPSLQRAVCRRRHGPVRVLITTIRMLMPLGLAWLDRSPMITCCG